MQVGQKFMFLVIKDAGKSKIYLKKTERARDSSKICCYPKIKIKAYKMAASMEGVK